MLIICISVGISAYVGKQIGHRLLLLQQWRESSEDDYPERHQDQEKNSSQLVANLTLKGESEESLPPNIGLEFENDDAAWVMSCCFLIFTMQTGFGIYEAGK